MRKEQFKQWLMNQDKYDDSTIATRVSNCMRLNDKEGDLDTLYRKDRCCALLEKLVYTTDDERENNPALHSMEIDGNVRTGTSTLKTALNLYIRFCDEGLDIQSYADLKVGMVANLILRKMLENGLATKAEIELLQTAEYSKSEFDIQYPVLLKTSSEQREKHYYKDLLSVDGEEYRLCCEWFEVDANNDRPYLLKWIESHRQS